MRTAQVVPDLATFAVDDGFAYAVPDGLELGVGSIVRVPLGSRRVRGFVVGERDGDPGGLKEIAAVSGDLPIFDDRLLQTLRWAALHYVAPLSVLLAKAAPPNLPRFGPQGPGRHSPQRSRAEPLAESIATGRRIRPAHLPVADELRIIGLVDAAVGSGRSAIVIVPTVAEGAAAVDSLRTVLGDAVVAAWSQMAPAAVTRSWVEFASVPGTALVATREGAWWPGADIGLGLVLGEGRRGMKERQTPTTHVREVLRRRGAVERFPVIGTGPVPTAETVASGVEIIAQPGRSWPLTEIVDRTEDPPGSGVVSERVRAALRAVAGRGGSAFILCPRREGAVRCVRCRAVRLCRACAASMGRSDECPRCGTKTGSCPRCEGRRFESAASSVPRVLAEIATIVGTAAGEAGSDAPIVVGTERDMPPPAAVDLAAAIDGDGAVFAPNYRAAEDALRLLVRLAAATRRGRTNRAMVQTSRPDHPVYQALRRGSAEEFMEAELGRRRDGGFPPVGELMAIEMEDPPSSAERDLRQAVGDDATILGPAAVGARSRWLVQGSDLSRSKVALRPIVQAWRESKARVRIDVDPLEL